MDEALGAADDEKKIKWCCLETLRMLGRLLESARVKWGSEWAIAGVLRHLGCSAGGKTLRKCSRGAQLPAGGGEQSRANVSKPEAGGSRSAGGGEQSRLNVHQLHTEERDNNETTRQRQRQQAMVHTRHMHTWKT